jgi:hypothetical protein
MKFFCARHVWEIMQPRSFIVKGRCEKVCESS